MLPTYLNKNRRYLSFEAGFSGCAACPALCARNTLSPTSLIAVPATILLQPLPFLPRCPISIHVMDKDFKA